MSSDVTVTQAHVGWAGSIAQHLCHSADRDAAIRLVADAFARFEAEVLARHRAPDAEPVANHERDALLRLAIGALTNARAALHHHYVEWDGEPEDGVPLVLARAECDAAISVLSENTHPAEPVAQAVEALRSAERAIAEYYRYWTGGETRGSYDGKPERQGLWEAQRKARAALAAMGERQ